EHDCRRAGEPHQHGDEARGDRGHGLVAPQAHWKGFGRHAGIVGQGRRASDGKDATPSGWRRITRGCGCARGSAIRCGITAGLRGGRPGCGLRPYPGYVLPERRKVCVQGRAHGPLPNPSPVGEGFVAHATASAYCGVRTGVWVPSSSAMLAAASRPSATAVTTRSAPRTASPPANTRGWVVWYGRRSSPPATMRPLEVPLMPSFVIHSGTVG